jgi:hypothetical protein
MPLPGAIVHAKAHVRHGTEHLTVSQADGAARFCVAGGVAYDVQVELQGFKKKRVRSDIVSTGEQVDQPTRLLIQMKLQAISIVVE